MPKEDKLLTFRLGNARGVPFKLPSCFDDLKNVLFPFSSAFLDTSLEFQDNLFSVYHLYDRCRITLYSMHTITKHLIESERNFVRTLVCGTKRQQNIAADEGSNKRETGDDNITRGDRSNKRRNERTPTACWGRWGYVFLDFKKRTNPIRPLDQ